MTTTTFALHTDFLALDALLKATSVVHSGGAAKVLIQDGGVRVDGLVEQRRSCKIRPGQVVEALGQRIVVSRETSGDAA
ncbi:ribosome-associated protein [Sphaerotilus hippei]|uniref:Ribosome-associated protein n=1 Tax=Sphaerotilus hippei TaxID=744406 RepID=A0A318H479_9BURK|nr:RNA-binding S4 domain-containing protein [Sphaerotilus hippei]PXW97931.1 ribosome-associated protein [Sphaerotilus hippei]